MKHFVPFTIVLLFSGVFAAACGQAHVNPLGSGGSGTESTTAGPSTTAGVGTTTTGSGSCKVGGLSCMNDAECCSTFCEGGMCDPCDSAGVACQDASTCCTGFECNLAGKCCAELGTACSGSAQCCGGSACSNGQCVEMCIPDGSPCPDGVGCCSGECGNEMCVACSNTVTCKEVLSGQTPMDQLCGDALLTYVKLIACVCGKTCSDVCNPGDKLCGGDTKLAECTSCMMGSCGEAFLGC